MTESLNSLDARLILKQKNPRTYIDKIFKHSFDNSLFLIFLEKELFKKIGMTEEEFIYYKPENIKSFLKLFFSGHFEKSNYVGIEKEYVKKLLSFCYDMALTGNTIEYTWPFILIMAIHKKEIPEELLTHFIDSGNSSLSRLLCSDLVDQANMVPPDVLIQKVTEDKYHANSLIKILTDRLLNSSVDKDIIKLTLRKIYAFMQNQTVQKESFKLFFNR